MKQCGLCTLCCELLPVREIGVKAFQGCSLRRTIIHAAGPGCSIYPRRPHACRAWSCGWLMSPDLGDEYRPDRVGFVVDVMKDLVQVNGKDADAAQIWVAPGHEEDWQLPAAHATIQALLEQSTVVLWRIPPGTGARAFALDEDGGIGYTPVRPHDESNDLGDERERQRRLNTLPERGKR